MRPDTPTIELVSPAKRVRAEVGVETVWIGSTVYPDCPVWRVWFDGRPVLDTSTLGLVPRTGLPLACGMCLVKFSRHSLPSGFGAGREARVRFAARDGRELEVRVHVTDMSAFCLVRAPGSLSRTGTDLSLTRFPEGSVLWGEEQRCDVQRPTLNAETGGPQVRFVPSGKVVAFWRHRSEQHLVCFDRPGGLAERRFAALEQLDRLEVKDGRAGIDRLFQEIPFTKGCLPTPVFSDRLTPAYRAAFELAMNGGSACDDFWVMRGEPGQFIVAARRQGEVWTIGGVTGEPRTLTVRLEELWLRMPSALRSLAYTLEITRDPVAGEEGAVVRESFGAQAPDVRVVLDMARDGGFLLEFRAECGRSPHSNTGTTNRHE